MTDKDRLTDLIYCACRNYDEYEDSFHENGMSPMESFEEFAADYLIANGVTVNEWRPESEPPKEDGAYLVSLTSFSGKHTWQDVCKFSNSLEKVDAFDFKGIKRAGWYSYKDGDYYEVDDITHWMPLPNPPKEVLLNTLKIL